MNEIELSIKVRGADKIQESIEAVERFTEGRQRSIDYTLLTDVKGLLEGLKEDYERKIDASRRRYENPRTSR